MSLRALVVAVLLGAVTHGPAPASAASEGPVGPKVALSTLAATVADHVAHEGAQAPVGVWVDGESPELAQAFATVLAAELSRRQLAPVAIDAPNAAQAEARGREKGARSLARVTLSLENGLLQARGDLLGTWVNFWSGQLATRPLHPAAGLEASTEADAHALALAAAALSQPLANAAQTGEVRMIGGLFTRIGQWTSALAAGDLDGDGKDEIVALTPEEILAFSADGQLLARREHRTALPLATAPSREPFGALAVLRDPARLAYLPANRAKGEQLALEGRRAGFRVLGPLEDAPLGLAGNQPLTGKLVPGQSAFAPEVKLASGPALQAPSPFTTASVFTGPSGSELLVVAANGVGVWRGGLAPESPSVELRDLGAATALADVDGDGASEVITTESSFRPDPEVLRVLRGPAASATGGDPLRFRKELPRGRALQVIGAQLDSDLAQELIVALWMPDGTTELWLFRRAR